MDFSKRLEKAIERGHKTREQLGQAEEEKALNEEELRTLHSKYRLDLSEHIESCMKQLADQFPGFRFQTVVEEDGWGARISRDDYAPGSGQHSKNLYSRLEMLIRPFSSTHIIELSAKGTVRNREVINRNHYQFLSQVDLDSFIELIDLWILEYAEKFAAA
ncbi:MAG: hypothetical protein Tsb009_06850 [Planctomycetaceae bacterium]